MQQHRKRAHKKHTAKVQNQNATTFQWSRKASQTSREIRLMRQTLCNSIPWHQSVRNQPTWRNNLQHHRSRWSNQCSQNFTTKNCALCVKERLAIPKQSRSNPQLLINSNNEICGACGHRPRFHRSVKQTTPGTNESINDKRVIPTNEVTTDFVVCNVCLADVLLEALWGPTTRFFFCSFPEH